MEPRSGTLRLRRPGVRRAVGAASLFLLLSMCTTFSPPRVVSPSVTPAATGSAAPPGPRAPVPSTVPAVSNLPAPATPPAASVSLPLAGDLPTPALPAAELLPAMPRPGTTTQLLTQAVPAASLVGDGEATVGGVVPEVIPPAIGVRNPLASAAGKPRDGGVTRTEAALAASESPASAAASTPVSAAAPPAEAAAAGPVSGSPSAPSRPAAPTPAVAGPQDALGSAAPAAAAPPGDVRKLTRTVYARVGDDITIVLDGGGWTFTGGGDGGKSWKEGVRYESRTVDSSGTTYTFKAMALGKWILDFQQQHAATGGVAEETIDLAVLTPQEFAQRLSAQSKTGASAAAAAGPAAEQLAAADWLYKEGKYAEALAAYERAWVPGDAALTNKIAELAYRIGHYAVAKKYWEKNFGNTGPPYGELAVAGLMKTATAQADAPALRALFDSVHSLPALPHRSDLLGAARYLFEAKQWEVALRYLQEYLRRYNGETGADVADYLLGQIYAGDTPMQSARKAIGYYRAIVDHYPTSAYYELARANIVYLERQFFEIR